MIRISVLLNFYMSFFFKQLILLGMGLQNKSVEMVAKEYNDTVQSVS